MALREIPPDPADHKGLQITTDVLSQQAIELLQGVGYTRITQIVDPTFTPGTITHATGFVFNEIRALLQGCNPTWADVPKRGKAQPSITGYEDVPGLSLDYVAPDGVDIGGYVPPEEVVQPHEELERLLQEIIRGCESFMLLSGERAANLIETIDQLEELTSWTLDDLLDWLPVRGEQTIAARRDMFLRLRERVAKQQQDDHSSTPAEDTEEPAELDVALVVAPHTAAYFLDRYEQVRRIVAEHRMERSFDVSKAQQEVGMTQKEYTFIDNNYAELSQARKKENVQKKDPLVQRSFADAAIFMRRMDGSPHTEIAERLWVNEEDVQQWRRKIHKTQLKADAGSHERPQTEKIRIVHALRLLRDRVGLPFTQTTELLDESASMVAGWHKQLQVIEDCLAAHVDSPEASAREVYQQLWECDVANLHRWLNALIATYGFEHELTVPLLNSVPRQLLHPQKTDLQIPEDEVLASLDIVQAFVHDTKAQPKDIAVDLGFPAIEALEKLVQATSLFPNADTLPDPRSRNASAQLRIINATLMMADGASPQGQSVDRVQAGALFGVNEEILSIWDRRQAGIQEQVALELLPYDPHSVPLQKVRSTGGRLGNGKPRSRQRKSIRRKSATTPAEASQMSDVEWFRTKAMNTPRLPLEQERALIWQMDCEKRLWIAEVLQDPAMAETIFAYITEFTRKGNTRYAMRGIRTIEMADEKKNMLSSIQLPAARKAYKKEDYGAVADFLVDNAELYVEWIVDRLREHPTLQTIPSTVDQNPFPQVEAEEFDAFMNRSLQLDNAYSRYCALRQHLADAHLYLVMAIAGRYKTESNMSDLIQGGVQQLIRACDQYVQGNQCLAAYASFKILGGVSGQYHETKPSLSLHGADQDNDTATLVVDSNEASAAAVDRVGLQDGISAAFAALEPVDAAVMADLFGLNTEGESLSVAEIAKKNSLTPDDIAAIQARAMQSLSQHPEMRILAGMDVEGEEY